MRLLAELPDGRRKRIAAAGLAALLALTLLASCGPRDAGPSPVGEPSEAPAATAAPEATPAPAPADEEPDAEENESAETVPGDDDGDGIIAEQILGPAYRGYLLTVLDPSRVVLSCVPENFGSRSMSVGEYAALVDGVAAINAGGFLDPDGKGNGASPDSLVVYEGEIYCPQRGVRKGFAGLDGEHRLVVGLQDTGQIKQAGIVYGACFGPVLIRDGEITDREALAGDLNPRTAIGQRADGAILFLIIEGRQLSSIGASYLDLAEILLAHGAVNACNLDGGRSTAMWYGGEYLRSAADLPSRNVPNAFVVLPLEDGAAVSSDGRSFLLWSAESAAPPAGDAEGVTEEERARLEKFAQDFARGYVAYFGATLSTYRGGYTQLRRFLARDSELDMRVRGAFAGMEMTHNGKNTLQTLAIEDLRRLDGGKWSCSIRISVLTQRRTEKVETELAMRLTLAESEGKIYAEALQYY